jgi:phospholipid transport system substrate-binding protein
MLISVFVIALSAAPASPMEVVKAGHQHVQAVLQSVEPSVEKLNAQADDFIDFVELSKRSLGAHWAKLNKKQQEEFSSTLKALLRANYAHKILNGDSNKGGGSEQQWGEETIDGNEAKVTSVVMALNDKFPIEYRLWRPTESAPWRIYDVVTEDVSLVETYQDQFRRVIAQKGYEGLLATLKAKKAALEPGERHASARP